MKELYFNRWLNNPTLLCFSLFRFGSYTKYPGSVDQMSMYRLLQTRTLNRHDKTQK